MLQHMNIEDVSLDSYSLSALEFVERSLRSKGYRTKEKLNAAELIYAYRLNRAVSRGRDLTLVKRLDPLRSAQPIEPTPSRAELDYMYETTLASQYPSSASTPAPVPPIPQMVVDEQPELQVKDSEPITLLDPLRVTYSFALNEEPQTMEIKDLHMLSSKKIHRLLISLKCSTNHLDKLVIEDVKVALKLKIEEETALDTSRVMAHPKRMRIKGRTQTLCPKFSAIGKAKNLSYLRILLEGLEGPVNCLEQEAYDLVHARIQVIEAKLQKRLRQRLN